MSDFHSHLIPNIDDGVKEFSEAFDVIAHLKTLGAETVVTTPHISQHAYPNTSQNILASFEGLRNASIAAGLDVQLAVAAEYYLDDRFQEMVRQKEPLLTFGRQHVLLETNYLSEPLQLKDVVFQLVSQGYRPMLAHPERYHYMTMAKAEDLRTRGVSLQVNLLSLIGYYSLPVQRLAEKLIDAKLVNALSSDCHQPLQARLLEKVSNQKYYHRALELPLVNFDIQA